MSTTYDLHVGAIGAVITLSLLDGAAVDLTTAAITEIRLRGPSGPRLDKTATIAGSPTLGVLTYTTVDGDLRHPGVWQAQARVVFDDDTEFFSSWFWFSVGPNL